MSRFDRSSLIGKRRKFGNGFCNGCNGCNGYQEEGRRKKEEGENFPITNYSLLQILKSKIEFPNPQFPNLKSKI
ncbi:hypothetical protein QUA43_09115 [Microcoleus sp. N9_B4]